MSMNYEAVCAFLFREARFLDDKDWDAWLAMYDEKATYWVPAWDDVPDEEKPLAATGACWM